MAKKAKPKHAARRIDVVFIRISSQQQNDKGQKANVQAMLRELGVTIPDEHWYAGTVSRRKVRGNEGFNHLISLVEADRVGTVYIETQDRWGTSDRVELFQLLGILRDHETRLYDLRAKRDVAEKDLSSELLAIVNSIKSEKELQDISYRSLRTRVNNFKESGSWPTGTHPFGYGKACFSADGKLLWQWHPVSRAKGQIFYPDEKGKLSPGPANIKIPRKTNRDRVQLVPSNNAEHVASVKRVFDLYTRVGMSRRKIAMELNKEGRKFYSRPFNHTYVTQLLSNPAYSGDTHFGKTQTGELNTFDDKGLVVEVKKAKGIRKREVESRIVKKGTHNPLVPRDVWRKAQAKLASEKNRVSFAPRNPDYYLKPIFVCGHCGKNLTGRTETHPTTGEKTTVYVCSTYVNSKSSGVDSPCGYHAIRHDDAEQLLLNKIKELDLQYSSAASEQLKSDLQRRLTELGQANKESVEQWENALEDGIAALLQYLRQSLGVKAKVLGRLEAMANRLYIGMKMKSTWFAELPLNLIQFKQAVHDAERLAVEAATKELAELTEKHSTYTLARARASEMEQEVLRKEIDRLEVAINECKPRTMPLSQRLQSLFDAECGRQDERKKLLADLPDMENREKGEALRALFEKVTLYWKAEFRPAQKKPDRPRKTDRKGRNRYHLLHDKIEWAFTPSNLVGSR